ncbi:MAG TPA: GNAT family N-acetyltransferase [Kofleriaceae bacterium]|nr:GNAT family N-acetyltransferase [Kofleriaceae bacterium]
MPGIDRVAAPRPHAVHTTAQPPPDWTAALSPADGFADPSWLAVFAGRAPDDRRWFTLRAADGAIAAGVAGHLQHQPIEYAPLDPAVLSPARSPFWPGRPQDAPDTDRRSAALALPCLWLVHPGLTSFVVGPRRHQLAEVSALVAGVADWAWRQGARSLVWPYVSAPDTALTSALEAAGFAPVPLTAEAWLPVPPDGWDGYLAALPAERRRDVRRERRRLADAGARARIGDRADLARCAELRAAQRRKYGQLADADAELSRLVVLTELADHCLVVVDSTGSGRAAPVSFCLFCRLGPDWHAMSTGTDYGDPAGRFAYFEVCFYAAVEAAAAAGAQRIGYGHAATFAKRWRGCEVQVVTAWARARDPGAQRALVELGRDWEAAHARAERST